MPKKCSRELHGVIIHHQSRRLCLIGVGIAIGIGISEPHDGIRPPLPQRHAQLSLNPPASKADSDTDSDPDTDKNNPIRRYFASELESELAPLEFPYSSFGGSPIV